MKYNRDRNWIGNRGAMPHVCEKEKTHLQDGHQTCPISWAQNYKQENHSVRLHSDALDSGTNSKNYLRNKSPHQGKSSHLSSDEISSIREQQLEFVSYATGFQQSTVWKKHSSRFRVYQSRVCTCYCCISFCSRWNFKVKLHSTSWSFQRTWTTYS